MADGGADGMWLGVSDTESDGVFKWSNGMLDEEVQYKKWGTNQPRTRDVSNEQIRLNQKTKIILKKRDQINN